jgi:exopolysaccharide production protein ExoQ
VNRTALTAALRIAGVAGVGIGGIVLAAVGAAQPLALLIPPALLAAYGAARFAQRRPEVALPVAVFAVLISGTKFRTRDPTASLEAEVDAQIIMELATFGLAAVLALGAAARPWARERKLYVAEAAFVAFGVLATISAFWSAAPLLTVVRAGQLLIVIGMALVMPRVLGIAGTVAALGRPLIVYTVGCAVLAKLFPWAKGTTVDYFGFQRFTWFAVHPIVAATLAGAAALFVIVELLASEAPLKRRLLGFPLWLALPPLLAVLAVTNSRGPLLAFALAAGLVIVLRGAGGLGFAAAATIALAVPMLFVAAGLTMQDVLEAGRFSGTFFEKLLYRGQTADEIVTITGRVELWDITRGLIAERPAFGVGYLGSRAALLEAAPWAAYAHNALLQTLLDVGFVGTLLLWVPMVRALAAGGLRDRRATESDLLGRAAGVTMLVFLIVNSFTAESFAAAPGYETLLAMGCVLLVERSRTPAQRASPGWLAATPVPATPPEARAA